MKDELEKYVNGDVNYTHLMNLLMSRNRKSDYYTELGKYIANALGDNLPPSLKFFEKDLKNSSKITNKFTGKLDRIYGSMAIFFLTSTLDPKSMRLLWGSPVKHSKFGEGFDRKRNYSYASYFVEIEGVKFHIGYDHRGTGIEPLKGTNINDLLKALKTLVDMYKQIS